MSDVHFELVGLDKALELSVVEFAFAFWQYGDASLCAVLPTAVSSDDEVYGFLDQVVSTFNWSDEELTAMEPYYWQAAVQLGYVGIAEAHLSDLLLYPGADVATTFIFPGPGKTPVFDPAAMQDVSDWLTTEGERMLFIYGENDPWSAGAFELGQAQDSYRFFVPEGNHGASISELPPAELQMALDALEAWTGVTPAQPLAPVSPPPPMFRRRL
jgi:hypothetical protein